jgi:beta-galactosidase
VKVVHADRPWPDDLAMLVAPGVQMVDDDLVRRFDQYASTGGHLVLTCRTALMDLTGQLFEGPAAAPIVPLIGASIDGYDVMPDDAWAHVEMGGKQWRWGAWGDLVKPHAGTEVIARYVDQFYNGTPAVTRAARGKGTVTYCGVFAEPAFTAALMEKLAADAKLPVTKLPERVQLLTRGSYSVCLNYQDAPFEVPAPAGAKFLVGSRQLGPAGVAVYLE